MIPEFEISVFFYLSDILVSYFIFLSDKIFVKDCLEIFCVNLNIFTVIFLSDILYADFSEKNTSVRETGTHGNSKIPISRLFSTFFRLIREIGTLSIPFV